MRVDNSGDGIRIGLAVDLVIGTRIPEVVPYVQEKVKNAVEQCTGLRVAAVDVDVRGLFTPRQDEASLG